MTAHSLTFLEWTTVMILATWSALLVYLLRHPEHPLRNHPASRLIFPTWRLFAPEPCDSDVHVVYRGWRQDTGYTEWRQTAAIGPHSPRTAIFHERNKAEKIVRDLIAGVINAELRGQDGRATGCYAALMRYVKAHIDPEEAQSAEFAIVESFGHITGKEPAVAYFSGLKPLEEID